MITLNFCSELDGIKVKHYPSREAATGDIAAHLGPNYRHGSLNSGAEAWVPQFGEGKSVTVGKEVTGGVYRRQTNGGRFGGKAVDYCSGKKYVSRREDRYGEGGWFGPKPCNHDGHEPADGWTIHEPSERLERRLGLNAEEAGS